MGNCIFDDRNIILYLLTLRSTISMIILLLSQGLIVFIILYWYESCSAILIIVLLLLQVQIVLKLLVYCSLGLKNLKSPQTNRQNKT